MKSSDLIHIQIDYENGMQSKKQNLSSEINLLNIKKNMRAYHFLRREEVKTRLKLYRKIKEVMIILNRLQKNIPEIDIPRNLIKGKTENENYEREIPIEKTRENQHNKDLETQLREIQEKLRAME